MLMQTSSNMEARMWFGLQWAHIKPFPNFHFHFFEKIKNKKVNRIQFALVVDGRDHKSNTKCMEIDILVFRDILIFNI
jgi:hypothetical protein